MIHDGLTEYTVHRTELT